MTTAKANRSIRLIGRTAGDLDSISGAPGEIFLDSSSQTLRVYNGNTLGGTTIGGGAGGSSLTTEQVQDIAAGLFNTAQSGVTVNYNDPAARITLTVANQTWSQITSKPTFATVATSGSYADLTNKPTIPTNTNQLTNGAGFLTSVGIISYNDLTNKPTIPTNTNQLTNGAGFLTSVGIISYNDLTNKPTIPTNTNQLTNGAGFLTSVGIISYTDLTNKPTIPTNTNQLTNGAGFLTSVGTISYADLTNKPTIPAAYSVTSINALSDVDTATAAPAANQPLVWNAGSSTWVPGSVPSLTTLSGVSVTLPTAGQVLKYNGSIWINDVDATSGGAGVGTVTNVSVTSANGFTGIVATASSTPAITITTSITGVLKGNGTAVLAATSGIDYAPGTSALTTGIIKSTTTTGALTIAVAGTDYQVPITLTTTGSSGAATFSSGTLNIPQYLAAEADTLATVTGRGATTATALSITNATASTSTTTGALQVAGGVGVAGALNLGDNLSVGGSISLPTASSGNGNISFNGTTLTIVSNSSSASMVFSTNSTSRMRIDQSGRVLVGSLTASRSVGGGNKNLQIEATYAGMSITSTNPNTNGPYFVIAKSRNNTVVLSGDELGTISFSGHDGNSFDSAAAGASIIAYVDGTSSTGTVPGRLTFFTSDASGTNIERLRINSAGIVSITSSTASTSTTTGALVVNGGVGVAGAIYAGNIYSNGTQLAAVSPAFSGLTDATSAGLTVDEIYLPAITRLVVTTPVFNYNIDQYSGDNPAIYAISGTTIAFNLQQSGSHPFLLQQNNSNITTANLIHVSTSGVVSTGSAAQAQTSGTLYWKIPASVSGTFRYICQNHGSMVGTITINPATVTGTGNMVLSNSPTLVTPALGSPSSVGTMPAFTLGGTVAGGGNQLNNVIIGASTPLAGAFTTVIASTPIGTASGGTGLGGATPFTSNGVVYASSSSALATGSALTFDGTLFSSTVADNTIAVKFKAASSNIRFIPQDGGAAKIAALNGAESAFYPLITQGSSLQYVIDTTEQMRLTSTGLGIGTSSPTGKLSVNRGSAGVLADFTDNINANFVVKTASSITTIGPSAGSTNFAFQSSNIEAMRLDSLGNLLVGTTNSSLTAGVGVKFISSATEPYMAYVTNTAAGSSNYHLYNTNATNNGFRFYVTSNGGIANYSANNINLSDERTKTNIQNAGSYLAKICAIPVRVFKYKDQADDLLNLGVIAQEVEVVAPELVDVSGFGETPEDGIPLKSIYQTDLQYALMKCIQELKAIIDTQATRITALENK